MTPDELKSLRHQMGLTQRELGEALGYQDAGATTIRRWEYGTRAIPPVAALLLRYMAKYGLPDSALD